MKPLFGAAGAPVHDDCRKALAETVSLLRDLGHEPVEAAPGIDGEACARAFLTILAAETRATIEEIARLTKRRASRADDEAATWALGLLGRATPASEYASASNLLQAASRAAGSFFERYPVLLTPTLAQPPAPIGALQPSAGERRLMGVLNPLGAGWLYRLGGMVDQLAAKTFAYMPYTPCSTSLASLRCPCPCTGTRGACRSACNSQGVSGTRRCCCGWPGSSSVPGPGRRGYPRWPGSVAKADHRLPFRGVGRAQRDPARFPPSSPLSICNLEGTNRMRAVVCKELGPVENLVYEPNWPDPVAGKGEVIVDVKSGSVNFPDVLMIQGKYQYSAEPPFVPGSELAGVVSAVGEGVTAYAVGDRVIARSGTGAFGEKAKAKVEQLTKVPEGVDFDTAATFMMTYGPPPRTR